MRTRTSRRRKQHDDLSQAHTAHPSQVRLIRHYRGITGGRTTRYPVGQIELRKRREPAVHRSRKQRRRPIGGNLRSGSMRRSASRLGWPQRVELFPTSRQSERLESPHRRRDAACKTMSAFRQARAGLYDRSGAQTGRCWTTSSRTGIHPSATRFGAAAHDKSGQRVYILRRRLVD
jgi:hypothetical protein